VLNGNNEPAPQEHQIHTGRIHRGNKLYDFGKCRCGAVLEGNEAIEAHRLLIRPADKQ